MTIPERPTASAVREIHLGGSALAHRAMAELRPAFVDRLDAFVRQVDEVQRPQGYRLFGSFEPSDDEAAAVAGFRAVTTLAWGPVLYVDDLSTRSEYRRRGHAAALLAAVSDEATRSGCVAIHLDSGHQRFDAHRLYLEQGFEIRSHHLVRTLPN